MEGEDRGASLRPRCTYFGSPWNASTSDCWFSSPARRSRIAASRQQLDNLVVSIGGFRSRAVIQIASSENLALGFTARTSHVHKPQK